MTVGTKDRRTKTSADTARRLARIVEQHAPYEGSIEDTTGLMCRECGYLDPCPTKRMGTETDPAGPWLGGKPGPTIPDISAGSDVVDEEVEEQGAEVAAAGS